MDEIRIIHTGDTHLGYRQYHSDVRRKDFLNAFSAVVDDAIDMSVDAVIHAGDLFDSRNPTLDDILDAMGLFSRLKSAGIPLLAIVGNHESKQNTQWLDLYSSLGLVTRLSNEPYRLGDVAIYGIDSVAKTKIPLFDYSIFDGKETDARYNLLVMHQLVKPFSFGDWDIKEVIDSIPFDIHAVLLGDNHKYEVTKVDDTWVTYPGSTERNSTSEREPRSYNIVTIKDSGIEISKRIIPTREFLFIPVNVNEEPNAIEDVFNAIMEHDIHDKVVFVELSGDVKARLDFSEIEKFLLSRGALVPGIKDQRAGVDTLNDPTLKVVFSDPDDVIKEEIRKMNLTSGGLLLDDLIRDSQIAKTRMGDEAELKLGELLEKIDFTNPVQVSAPVDELVPENSGEQGLQPADENSPEGHVSYSEPESSSEVSSLTVEEEKIVYESGYEIPLTSDKEDVDIPKEAEKKSSSEKKKNEDTPKPRQYNLGDYL
ncbi:exonuclease SbcCD subunit D [Methanolobus vulcani]|uniref:DNA double-strand break repair protein Mre11 n=1 Tax=Methanolobus vulcani TaxID=38026 RepID=A0A7Z8P3F5_9EURY|nr:exonuclease SbcCD subunit D [Methanolobus vulcani]TQD28242.1 exonuclease SbcCD subunit D [Methanolobus vulcani]